MLEIPAREPLHRFDDGHGDAEPPYHGPEENSEGLIPHQNPEDNEYSQNQGSEERCDENIPYEHE